MKWLYWMLLPLGVFTLGSCALPFIGGGIAGGGRDAVWTRKAAETYSGYRSPAVDLVYEDVRSPNVKQRFREMFDSFPEHTSIKQDSVGTLGEFTVSFRRQRLSVSRSETEVINERLPSAFSMHDLQVARGRLSGSDVFLFSSRSRASTGMCFVGLYRATGERLWTATIASGRVWDCHYSPNRITFLNPIQRLHISLSD